jgi:hypothetical protein
MHDGEQFGPVGQKFAMGLVSEDSIPAGKMNLLSAFNRDLKDQIESKTVKIMNPPTNHTIRNINQLLEPVYDKFEKYDPNLHGEYGYFETNKFLYAKVLEPGVSLVQLAKPNIVNHIRQFSGTYWKNATLNTCCVPDEEMEDLLARYQEYAEGQDVKLFVTGIKSNTSSTQVRVIFKDFTLRDVNIPPGGKISAFIFVRQRVADSVLAQFGRGIMHEGKMICVSASSKGKNAGRLALGSVPLTPKVQSIDLEINNLRYGVAHSTVRSLFEGFNVSRVVIKEGCAFFEIVAVETDRAVQTLKDKKFGDRTITAKAAERRK